MHRREGSGGARMSGGFLSELKRRNVIRMAGLYLVSAWLLVQVVSTVLPLFGAPAWLPRSIVILLALGLVPALAFAWVFELTPEGLKREADVPTGHSINGQTGRRMQRMFVALLVLALGYFAFDKFVLAPRRDAALVAATTKAAAQVRSEKQPDQSIAVLPLANAGGQDQQFFADGLSESMIISLSQFPGLKVIGRNSAFRFRDSKEDSVAIGRKLGVAHLLEGSVQHAGDVVRISLVLTDAADGSTLWSQRYDRPYVDLFKLQDEVTNAVATALKAELLRLPRATAQSDRPPSGNLEAYTAYLRGLKHWHNEDFLEAARYMSQAVQLDPGYAVAWALLSGSWSTVAVFSNEAAAVSREHMSKARHAADKALRLAPDLGSAHAARAYLDFYNFDYRDALAGCRRAVQLAPNDATVLNGCGFTLAGIGRLSEAIALRDRLLLIEPLYVANHFAYVDLLTASGRLDEAEKHLLRSGEEVAKPSAWYRLKLALLRDDANAAMEIARKTLPSYRDASMILAAQIGPDRAAADKRLADALADRDWIEQGGHNDNRNVDNRYVLAQTYALRGDAGRALEWLQRNWDATRSNVLFLLADPLLLRFRDDPRFIAFCNKVGLPPPSESDALSIDQIRAQLAEKR